MKCAIIAPHDLLDLTKLVDEYHLVLPQEMFRNPNYVRFYRDVAGYKILDNGEAEGVTIEPQDLTRLARQIDADEIVVPDVIGDRTATIARARDFERYVDPEFKYMGVLQGKDLGEIISMVYFYEQIPWITCIGIPRWLVNWDVMQRYTILRGIMKNYPELYAAKEWHCLGANSRWPAEVSLLSTLPGLRGMDTSLPVVYGLAGTQVSSTGGVQFNRKPDFFDEIVPRGSFQWEVIYDNVKQYLQWAGVDLSPEAPTS